MKEIPKFEIPDIQYGTPLSDAVKTIMDALIEHYNTYIVAQDKESD
jgi:hypothetical protein